MNTLSVKNFEQFQHYKDRTPPWIKLYNTLLEDYAFGALDDTSKGHLLLLWLLASRMENKIPNDVRWVSAKINANTPVNLQALIDAGFLVPYEEKAARGKREDWPTRYIKPEVRAAVFERDGAKCRQCGAVENLELDHVVPVSKGGQSEESNLQVLCRSCNRRKRATQPSSIVSVDAEHVATQDRSLDEERESETEVEREKDTAAGEPTFDRVKVVGERVLEAAGIDPARWLGNFAPISGWLRAGADPEFDIYPTIKQLTKRTGYTPPRSLNYFTDAILRAHAERMADPVPSGEPGKVRELRQERTPEEREWLDAYKTWAKAGRNGPPPQRAQFVKKEAAS